MSMPSKLSMISVWYGMGKSGTTGSPKRWASTLQLSSGPMGTLGSIIWGMVYMISWMRAAILSLSASSAASCSASALTAALLASIWACSSAFLASSVHFFSWPNRGPLALLSLLRWAFRFSASWRHLRYWASRSMTSSTRGILASWNFLWMFSLTASGFSRTNLMSSMMISPYVFS